MSPTVLVLTCLVLLLVALPASIASAEEEAPADPVETALASPQATGLLVTVVVEGSQAATAGVVPGDVLVSYGGTPVATIDALRAAIQAAHAETVELEVVRRDGSKRAFTIESGPIGVQLAPVEKGKGVEPLPPATGVTFDLSALAEAPSDDWYVFTIDGRKAGFEHATAKIEDGKLVMRREVAFDGGERWGVNHFDVTVVMTDEPEPSLISVRFENPIVGYRGEGRRAEGEEGKPILRYVASRGEETSSTDTPIPDDLPAITEYVIETLACFMPRKKGACLHYRPVTDMTGAVGRPAALLVQGEEEVEVGGTRVKALKMQIHTFASGPSTAFWVDARGRVVKADYVGAVTTAAAKEECLKDLHHGLVPRTAD